MSARVALALAAVFLACGTTAPSSTPSPVPTPEDVVLPAACHIVSATVTLTGTDWRVDCGTEGNRNARATIGTALLASGWVSCGPAAATESWTKNGVLTVVSEASGVPGDDIKMTQRPAAPGVCG